MFEDAYVDYMDCFKEAYKAGFRDGVETSRKNMENALTVKNSENLMKWVRKLLDDKPKTKEGCAV